MTEATTPAQAPVSPPASAAAGGSFRPSKVIEIELGNGPLSATVGLERYASVFALVRVHGVPLGTVRVPVSAGRCSAAVLGKAISDQLADAAVKHLVGDWLACDPAGRPKEPADLLDLPHPRDEVELPSLTVAVCTRDRVPGLTRCLEALQALKYPDERLELLVVDNAPSDDAARELVRERFPQVRYCREPRPGLNWARNRAISEARGDVVAYTDDDAVVDSGWAEAFGRLFAEHETVAAATGLVVPYELETRAQELFERYGGFGRGYQRTWHSLGPGDTSHVGAGRFGTGANMAYRRHVLAEIGAFDPALDVGTVTNGGGDLEMFFRVLQTGHTLVYEPRAVVWHRHRERYEQLRKQLTDHGIGFFAYAVRSMAAYPDARSGFLRFTAWWLRRWIGRRLLVSVVRPGRFPRELVLAELRGGLIGLTRYHRSRRTAAAIARASSTQTAAQ